MAVPPFVLRRRQKDIGDAEHGQGACEREGAVGLEVETEIEGAGGIVQINAADAQRGTVHGGVGGRRGHADGQAAHHGGELEPVSRHGVRGLNGVADAEDAVLVEQDGILVVLRYDAPAAEQGLENQIVSIAVSLGADLGADISG